MRYKNAPQPTAAQRKKKRLFSRKNAISMTQLSDLKGVGPKFVELLGKLHIHSLVDVLFHLPFRYEDRSRIVPIAGLRPRQPAVIQGEVRAASVVMGRRRSLVVRIQDHSGVTTLRFYSFGRAQKDQFKNGALIRCYGEPSAGVSGLEFYHP